MIRRLFFFLPLIGMLFWACEDNDSFSAATGNRLSFSEDTVSFDTLFSGVPSVTATFWVRNTSSDGIRILTARLERSGQSGYRVNVDGLYLDPVGNDFEVRKGDSILVFVEVTTRDTHKASPQLVEDQLVFTLESGVEQRVLLRAYSWDATKVDGLVVRRDTVIESSRPVVVYGDGIEVCSGATLTLRNTELYFHDGAGMKVYGTIHAENCLFRGDRLERMFYYLPYDRISGQWEGIWLLPSENRHVFTDSEIRNAVDAVVCDSTTLSMTNTVVHNSSGAGLAARHSLVTLTECQLTNTLGDCLLLDGCDAVVEHCTIGQFYPFSANRGYGLRFSNSSSPLKMYCKNTLVTGYADDVVMVEKQDASDNGFDFHFADCLLRTPKVDDEQQFERVIWETPKDSVQGKEHFVTIDEENFYYDFTLDAKSPALAKGIGRIEKSK